MNQLKSGTIRHKLVFITVLTGVFWAFGAYGAPLLLNVDTGCGPSSGKLGLAATGHGPSDFWNYYTRDDGQGGYRRDGSLADLRTAEGTPTGTGLAVFNAPGCWGNGSSDSMYNSYIYPLDKGNIAVVVTNLAAGVYDFYVYGIDARYELSVAGLSHGEKSLPDGPAVNPVIWQEGLQYVRFPSVVVVAGNAVTLTVRAGTSGYGTIAGLQIAAVGAANHPPVANSQAVLVPQDGGRRLMLTGSDTDGDPLAYTVVNEPAHGSLRGTPPDHLAYTPAPGYEGPDSFTFKVNDGHEDSLAATVLINVFRRVAGTLVSVDVGGAAATGKVGPAVVGHNVADFWNYYTRNDGHGGYLRDGFLADLKSVEGTPTGAGMTVFNAPGSWGNGSADEMYNTYNYPFDGGNITLVVTNLTAGAYDFYIYGQDAHYEVTVSGSSHGTKTLPDGPVLNPVVWQEGLQYVLFPTVRVGTGDPVTLTVRPGRSGYATVAGLQIAVAPNHAPVALAQQVVAPQNGSKAITLSGMDPDGDPLSYSIVGLPTRGVLVGSPPSLTYSPNTGYSGTDSFTFTVSDGRLVSAPAQVSITVQPAQPPVLLNVDTGCGPSTSKVGLAATGHGASDFWNHYTRDDGKGGYRRDGFLANLKTAEGTPTGTGLVVYNAPGCWGNGSSDVMYNSYIYPFDGGNVTVLVTNLAAGGYDFYVYGIDARYELAVAGLSYGEKPLPDGPVVNPVVWQEGLQYVRFQSVAVVAGDAVTLTVRARVGRSATISGMQIAAIPLTNTPPGIQAIISPGPALGPAVSDPNLAGDGPGLAPRISVAIAAGQVTISFVGVPDRTYLVEASTDLLAWAVVGTAADTSDGVFHYTEKSSLAPVVRYYRVVVP